MSSVDDSCRLCQPPAHGEQELFFKLHRGLHACWNKDTDNDGNIDGNRSECECPELKDGETVVFLGDSITQQGAGPTGYVTLFS